MDEIARHYGDGTLLDRIMGAATADGLDPAELTFADLAPVDEFHVGGRAATASLLERAAIPPGSRILDVGCGLGGTARYLAATGSHTVTGVDLTPEYVEVARSLTALVGLDGLVTVRRGDACALPFPAASFDAAVMLHVGMNVDDKASAFAEVARVLVDGGRFAMYEIMGLPDAAFDFPVPWAASRAASFLAPADDYVHALEAAGFTVEHVADRTEFALRFFEKLRRRTGPPPSLGLHLLMGDEASLRYGNMVRAVEAGEIAPVEIVASTRG